MKISVITVCFNSQEYILDCIKSVNAQDYTDIEHVFVDGGSTDDTLSVIKEFACRDRVVISEPDRGLYDAMNKGVGLASGEILCFLNSDDKYTDNSVLTDVMNCFCRHKGRVKLVHGSIQYFHQQHKRRLSRVWTAKLVREAELRRGIIPPHPATFFSREALTLHGPFNLQYQIAADFDQIKRILIAYGYEQGVIERVLVDMRVGGISTSGLSAVIKQNREILHSLRGSFPDLNTPLFLARKAINKLTQYVN